MNPSTMHEELKTFSLFGSDVSASVEPMWRALSPATSPAVLEDLTLNHGNATVRKAAASNSSTPVIACAKWLLEHNIDLGRTTLKWAMPTVLEGRVNKALAENGCNLVEVADLPLSWKLKLLVTLG